MRYLYISFSAFLLSQNIFASSCEPLFIEDFKTKNACVRGNNSSACTLTAINAGTLGAGAGGWIGSLMDEKSGNSQELKKFKRLISSIREFRTREYGNLKAAMELKSMAFKQALGEIAANKEFRELSEESRVKIWKRTREILEKNDSKPYVKQILADSDYTFRDGYSYKAFEFYEDKLKSVIGSFYPDEMDQLSPIRAKEKVYTGKNREEYLRDWQESLSKTKNPKLIQAFDSILNWTSIEMESFFYQWRDKSRPWKSGNNVKHIAQNIRTAKLSLKPSVSEAGKAGGAVMGAVGLPLADLGIKESLLKKCKYQLNLQDKDITFLRTRIEASLTSSCEDIKLRSLEVIDEAAEANDGELSDGMCSIIKQQDKALDKYFTDADTKVSLSCSSAEAQTANYHVSLSGSNFLFVNSKSGQKITAPLISYMNYPDFNRAVVSNGDKTSKFDTDKLLNTYRITHQPQMIPNGSTNAQEIDADNSCQKDSVINCEMIQAANQMMQARSLQQAACSGSNSSSIDNGNTVRPPVKGVQ